MRKKSTPVNLFKSGTSDELFVEKVTSGISEWLNTNRRFKVLLVRFLIVALAITAMYLLGLAIGEFLYHIGL